MKTITISIKDLELIIELAKRAKSTDSSLSETVELSLIKESDTHLGSDMLEVWLKSSYSECVGHRIS